MKTFVFHLLLLAGMLLVPSAFAQRGVGDSIGVVRQGVRPAVVSLSGTVVEIKQGPCELTTGRALVGAHVLLRAGQAEPLNIHLGPATEVDDLVAKLSAGAQVTVNAFRTDALPEGAYIAQSVVIGSETYTLRDENLKPAWSRGPGMRGRGVRRGARF